MTDRCTPGTPPDITVDAYQGVHSAVMSRACRPRTGAKFSLLPPDNATGNTSRKWCRRIPVRIHLIVQWNPAHMLRPGMSVVATIKTQ